MNMAPSIPISQFAPNVAGMASLANVQLLGQPGVPGPEPMPGAFDQGGYAWYNEEVPDGQRNGQFALANSPHSGSDITAPMYGQSMTPAGMTNASETPVGSPMRGPMPAQFYKPPQLEEPGSPHAQGPGSPYGDQQGYMAQPMNSPHGVMMVPVMPHSPQHHPQSPHGPMVQGNMMMMMAPTLDSQQSPFGALYESGPPSQAPPKPPEKKQQAQTDDDLFDVKSFDSMELYDQAPMPIQPPAGLMINKYGMMTMESVATNSGEGTSASASNSD